MKLYTYLALGDSYTIGEALPLQQSFPYQTIELLRKEKINIAAPEIIAKTGWTTDELAGAIDQHTFLPQYDFVSLLIGVNNQYRGHSAEEYKKEFESLLQKAIGFAGNNNSTVIVLSIPDYSVTPFAKEMDVQKIEREIKEFNSVNHSIAEQCGVHYIYITDSTQKAKNDLSLLAEDGLHPSAKEYFNWAKQVAEKIKSIVPKTETTF
jgi:lysophospholipase L1-like esterase